MKKVHSGIVLLIFLLLLPLISSCQVVSNLPFFSTNTPIPTFTPYPTSTPYPTFTPYPTYTPLPTSTLTSTPTTSPTKTKIPYTGPTLTPTKNKNKNDNSLNPITWINETSHVIKIVAVCMQATYTVTLKSGETQTVWWARGQCSIKYYLDGGSSPAGTDSLTIYNEEHKTLRLNFK